MKRITKLLIAVGMALMLSMTSCDLWWDAMGPDHGAPPPTHGDPGGRGGGPGQGGGGGGYRW